MTVRPTALLAAAGLVLSLSSPAFTRAPSPTPTTRWPETGPQVAVYDAGFAIVEQPGLRDTDFFEMPIPGRGVLAVPTGAGPFPVTVFVHGSYP